jgi:hypothetical protein
MALPGMAPPMDGPAPGMDADAPPPSASPYAKAGRTIRHALADQDDEALGQAICDLVDIHQSKEPDGDEGPEEGPKKPNLALILASKGKGK